jgi:hypothetical protein
MGGSLPGRGHWFFTPPPFCFAFSREVVPDDPVRLPGGPWLTFGLLTAPGAHTFTAFAYDAIEDGFSFRLAYEGKTTVDGRFVTPSVALLFGAADPYGAIARYRAELGSLGLLPSAQPRPRAAWWSAPMFCGWGAQCHLAMPSGSAPDQCTQANYDAFLGALEAEGLRPPTVVIDDRWQREYGTNEVDTTKWPDLRGWIARRHAAGQKVLLWLKAWDPGGLPDALCVRAAGGMPVAADPTNPEYERLLRASVRRMLGPDGYDADGFKVDFTAQTPSGASMKHHGPEWGIEMLHRLLDIVYGEAKRTKPDALVITHTPNPYFTDVTDMLRLNDIMRLYDLRPGAHVVAHMTHRARVVQAACPDTLIDTDNWAMPDLATWRDYLRVQPALGVPSLYYATHIDQSGEALEPSDYEALRRQWAGWSGWSGR